MLALSSVLRSRAFLLPSLAPPLPPPPPPHRLLQLPLLRAVSSSSSSVPPPPKTSGMEEQAAQYKFGPYKIDAREVFQATALSYAMVISFDLAKTFLRFIVNENAKDVPEPDIIKVYAPASSSGQPIHTDVLVCPKREVKRFADLSSDETSDLWVTAKEVGAKLEQYHKASSLTFAIQDGPQAGQTVAHVHIHVIPRKKGDFENNDEIYDAIDVKEREMKEKLDLDVERKDRTMDEMAHEATEYRALFS